MNTLWKITSRISPSLWLISITIAVVWLPHDALASEKPKQEASVYCVVSEESAFPFSAGKDHCFKEINGKKSAYKSAMVCAVNTTDRPRLRFMYSATAKATCMEGSPVTKEDDSRWGLAMFGKEEQKFLLKHVDTK